MTGMAAQMLWGTEGQSYKQLVERLGDRFGGRGVEERFQHSDAGEEESMNKYENWHKIFSD